MPAKKNSELVAFDVSKFQIETIETTISAEDITEELDGLGNIPLDRAKFPGSGGTYFELTDDENEDESMPVDHIEGVIVHHHAMNSRWANGFDGTNEPPVCSAIDGKLGLNVETGELIQCADCPYNEFGSADNNSKVCRNIHRLYISCNSNPVPLILALPPTSLKSFRSYVSKKLLLKGKKCNQVVTRITLKTAKSSGNMKYSKAVFEKLGDLNDAQKEAAEKIGLFVKGIVAAEAPVAADYNTEPPTTIETTAENVKAEAPQLPPASNTVKESESAPAEYSAPPVPQEAPSQVKEASSPYDGFDFIDVEPNDDGNPFA